MYLDMELGVFGTVRLVSALCDKFRHCEIFSNFCFRIYGPPAPAPDNYFAAYRPLTLPYDYSAAA